MTNERYKFLMDNEGSSVTDEEFKEGWHFCYEWDGLLVGPGMPELKYCCCASDEANPTP